MCRWIAYRGETTSFEPYVTEPEHSLIAQSIRSLQSTTGSNGDGTLAAGLTCADWTSASTSLAAQVGHSDGLGPNQSTTGTLSSWNSAHANLNCADTAPRGGAGRFYCFAR